MFKKIFFGLAIIAGLASCKGDYQDWTLPQSNEATSSAVSFDATAAAASIDLNSSKDSLIQIIKPTVVGGRVETIKVRVGDNSLKSAKHYDLYADSLGYVTREELNNAVISVCNREVTAHALSLNISTNVLVNTVSIPQVTGTLIVNVTPIKSEYVEYIYVAGNQVKDWSPSLAAALHSPDCNGIYTGYTYLDGGFKFTKARNWDAEYNWNDFSTVPAFLTNSGSDSNINCTEAGFYKLTVNVATKTIEAQKYGTITLIGSAINGDANWSTDSDPMTWDSAIGAYKITMNLTVGELKVRADKAWDLSWGYVQGQTTTATSDNGENVKIAAAGTYKVVFYPSCDGVATITVTPVSED